LCDLTFSHTNQAVLFAFKLLIEIITLNMLSAAANRKKEQSTQYFGTGSTKVQPDNNDNCEYATPISEDTSKQLRSWNRESHSGGENVIQDEHALLERNS